MSSQTQTYQRFPIARRIEHIVMILSFSLLGLTGLPQKFPHSEFPFSSPGFLEVSKTCALSITSQLPS